MTNRKLAKSSTNRPYNKKDGGRPQLVTQTGFWGVADFCPIRDTDKWTYKSFTLIQGPVDCRPGWIAICEDGRQIPIGSATPAEIAVRLNDEIATQTGIGDLIDVDDFMTEGLPQTNPPRNTRPGAEYGVWI